MLVIQRARQPDLPIQDNYFTSFSSGVGYYLKHGFEDLGSAMITTLRSPWIPEFALSFSAKHMYKAI